MRFALFATYLMLLACASADGQRQAAPMPDSGNAGSYQVGYRVLEIPYAGSIVTVALWYPTASEARVTPYGQSPARGMLAVDAPVMKGPWPLLIHAHGFGGGGIIHAAQLERYAANGYIVAAPDHGDQVQTVRIREKAQGNAVDMFEHLKRNPFTVQAYSYRPKELAAVLDGLLASAPEHQIDQERIALLGHSLGGWTATTVALADRRIKALVLYSMGELSWLHKQQRFFEAETLKTIRIPTLFFYGEKERKANPLGVYARYCFEQVGGPAYLTMIPDGDHFVYCDRVFAPRSGARAEQSAKIISVTSAFLERHLKDREVAVEADEPRASETARLGPGEHSLTLSVAGVGRKYVVHVPPTYRDQQPIPVVLMFHGGGGTARATIAETGLTKKADQAGFIAVFPEGTAPDPSKPGRFRDNPQTWNDGSGRFHAGQNNVDDVGFVNALIDDLLSRFSIDPKRIYAAGFSNGSSMAYRLGAELPQRLAAIAPIASSGLRVEVAQLARPVPLLVIQGTADPRNPLEGGDVLVFGKIDKRPPVADVVRRWAKLNGCSDTPKILRDDNGIKALAYSSDSGTGEVHFYTVEGLGHTWPGGKSLLPESLVGKTSTKLQANDVIWDFFSRHALP